MTVKAQDAKVSGHATRGRASKSALAAQPANLTMEIVVRDKDGNVKYAGPLVMTQQGDPDDRNALDRRA
jgi:hypothetical protein